jgi:hypothetical protein
VWSPSACLYVRPGALNGNIIQFDHLFGQAGNLYAEPCWPGQSQLLARTVQAFGVDHALVTRIDPNGPFWLPGVGKTPAGRTATKPINKRFRKTTVSQ